MLIFFYPKVHFIFWVLKRTASLRNFWVCTVWTRTRSSLIRACSVCLHIFGNHTFILEQGQYVLLNIFTFIWLFHVNYIFQTVWTKVRLLTSSLISVYSACLHDIYLFWSKLKNYKDSTFLLNTLRALLLNAFLWPILQTVWIRSDIWAVSSRFIMFTYAIELFWCKSDESLWVRDIYCKRYGPKSDCLGAVWSGFIVLSYMIRFVLGKIEHYKQM